MEPRLSLVTLGVTDLPRSIAFYRDVVGWQPTSDGDGVAFFDLGGVVLGLWPHVELAADEGMPGQSAGPYHGFSLAYNCRSRDEVDEIFGRLSAAGVHIPKPPVETDWGGYSGYFADPDEHRWEVAWNPFWTVKPDGRIDLSGS